MQLNCDMGESYGSYTIGADEKVMPHVDMANIACGMHAADPEVMNKTVALAAKHSVRIGAHPGYPDLQGFGRREMALSPAECKNIVIYQLGALAGFCRIHNTMLSYVKPHGALYNTMMRQENILIAIIEAAASFQIPLMLLASSSFDKHRKLAQDLGTDIILEGFVDRGYQADGTLVPRGNPGALLDRSAMRKRVQECSQGKPLTAIDGTQLNFPIDSLCVHGDGEGISLIKEFKEIIHG